jgi:hypothetical protein
VPVEEGMMSLISAGFYCCNFLCVSTLYLPELEDALTLVKTWKAAGRISITVFDFCPVRLQHMNKILKWPNAIVKNE